MAAQHSKSTSSMIQSSDRIYPLLFIYSIMMVINLVVLLVSHDPIKKIALGIAIIGLLISCSILVLVQRLIGPSQKPTVGSDQKFLQIITAISYFAAFIGYSVSILTGNSYTQIYMLMAILLLIAATIMGLAYIVGPRED